MGVFPGFSPSARIGVTILSRRSTGSDGTEHPTIFFSERRLPDSPELETTPRDRRNDRIGPSDCESRSVYIFVEQNRGGNESANLGGKPSAYSLCTTGGSKESWTPRGPQAAVTSNGVVVACVRTALARTMNRDKLDAVTWSEVRNGRAERPVKDTGSR